jgi:hypothetical protein
MMTTLPPNVCTAQLDLLACAAAPPVLTEEIDATQLWPFLIDYWRPPPPCAQWFRR